MLIQRLFLKLYLVLAMSAALIGLTLDHLMQRSLRQDSLYQHALDQKSTFLLLQQNFSQLARTEWEPYLFDIIKHLQLAIELKALTEVSLAEQEQTQLSEGKTLQWWLDERLGLVQQVKNSDQLIIIWIPLPQQTWNWTIIFYTLLGLPALLVLWPLSRDLKQLENASRQITGHSFSQRVNLLRTSVIHPIGSAFDQMVERISILIEEQKQLTNAVSHELRTPLARLKFALTLLKNTNLDETNQSAVQAMEFDVEELNALIEEMLSYARLDNLHSNIELQTVDVKPWLSSIVEDCLLNTSIVQVQLDCKLSSIDCDPHLMARALSNLILNGLRFAHKIIDITVEETSSSFQIRIADDGPGIPEPHRQQVFEPFTRLDESRDKQSGGFGLGLAITKRIIERHFGSIVIKTSVYGGTEFVIEWPRNIKLHFKPK